MGGNTAVLCLVDVHSFEHLDIVIGDIDFFGLEYFGQSKKKFHMIERSYFDVIIALETVLVHVDYVILITPVLRTCHSVAKRSMCSQQGWLRPTPLTCCSPM
jgi:hypothetical protein